VSFALEFAVSVSKDWDIEEAVVTAMMAMLRCPSNLDPLSQRK